MTREEAEKLCRTVIANHAGEELTENLFRDSVDQLLREVNCAKTHGKETPSQQNQEGSEIRQAG